VKDQKQEAGDNAQQYQAGSTMVVNNNYGVTEERFQELAKNLETFAMELWQKNAPRLVHEASTTYDNRASKMASEVVTQTVATDPELLERFKDPRAQVALLKAQQAYGESGDDQLGTILAGLVVSLVAEPVRTRREIVLREAIECAPRLTPHHLNALVVIVLLTRMVYRNATDVGALITALDNDFRPYYGAIPVDAFEYSYMGATAAGVYLPGLGKTSYSTVFNDHPNAMYPPFRQDEIPEGWAPDEDSANELRALLWLLKADPIENSTLKISPEVAGIVLRADPDAQPPLTEMQMRLREFAKARSVTEAVFTATIREQKPDLAAFFDTIDTTHALHFRPTPVGMMLARHAVAARSAHAAEQMDTMFVESG
jgi:hypothetical protein